ncbi:energy transducer TonB [Desulfosediminicola sp.]|uniref:energy transducer TonB n=1 Tax=Desulfosediminicola sp. TaxID=2886825 RepID=UPI003AF3004B
MTIYYKFICLLILGLVGCTNHINNAPFVELNELDDNCLLLNSNGEHAEDGCEIEYYDKIREIVHGNWQIPVYLNSHGLESIIIVQVSENGSVEKMAFESRSKNDEFNECIVKAIRKTKSLPKMPKEFERKCFQIGLSFTTINRNEG